ncbi:hypothetical protein NDU88_007462 [Pleurodeles waltl]|uniref:Uncharacterized protein n=1 Tax=Pleurodeles waltl TaxID=8319 RepID=A0AAV7PLQ6_PLEWA|nr:hypothetical protein NDU88_007462 [Pleurodeles waltl]
MDQRGWPSTASTGHRQAKTGTDRPALGPVLGPLLAQSSPGHKPGRILRCGVRWCLRARVTWGKAGSKADWGMKSHPSLNVAPRESSTALCPALRCPMVLKSASHVGQGRQQGSLGDEVPPQSKRGPQGEVYSSAPALQSPMVLKSTNHMGQCRQQAGLGDEVPPHSKRGPQGEFYSSVSCAAVSDSA